MDIDETAMSNSEIYQRLRDRMESLYESEDASLRTATELKDIFYQLKDLNLASKLDQQQNRVYIDQCVLDATILSTGSEILVKCIDSVNKEDTRYDPTEFANNILRLITDDDIEELSEEHDVLKLLNICTHLMPCVPEYDSLFGAFDLDVEFLEKQKKVRRRELKIEVKKQQLKQVKNIVNDEEAIEETLAIMFKVLHEHYANNGGIPINYLDYVIDSECFYNTVSNMFYLSFLVRDGRAAFSIENDQAYIQPMKKSASKKFHSEGGHNCQMISSLTMEEWEKLKSRPGYLQMERYESRRNSRA